MVFGLVCFRRVLAMMCLGISWFAVVVVNTGLVLDGFGFVACLVFGLGCLPIVWWF